MRASDGAVSLNYPVSCFSERLFTYHPSSLMRWCCFQGGKTWCTARTPENTILEPKKSTFTAGVHNLILFFFSFSVGFHIKHYHPCVWSCYPLMISQLLKQIHMITGTKISLILRPTVLKKKKVCSSLFLCSMCLIWAQIIFVLCI